VLPKICEASPAIGVQVRAGEQRLLYIPGCAQMTDALKRRLPGASVVLFDDTLWRDDEMTSSTSAPRRARAWAI
jgi:pyrroloquinoline quinone biosynthesis protein B